MKNKYIEDCPCWINQHFLNANINFEKPYNKDTLEYLNALFYEGLIQKIYRLIRTEYKDLEIQKALFEFIVDSWNEKITNEKLQ